MALLCRSLFLLHFVFLGSAERQGACPSTPICEGKESEQSYSYTRRPYGENAWWNVPACHLGVWKHSAEYAARWFGVTNGVFYLQFGFSNVNDPNDFSSPIYYSSNATQTRRVKAHVYGRNFNLNEVIPWNPSWKPASGSDHHMIVLDEDTGKEWNLWCVDILTPATRCAFTDFPDAWNGYTDVCVGSANLVKNSAGAVVDYRTFEGTGTGARGLGMQNQAGLVTAEEVAAGEIRHALFGGIFNSMFGPWCTEEEMQDPAKYGHTCGYAMRPAGNVEWASYSGHIFNTEATSPYRGADPGNATAMRLLREKTVPEGMRFALKISDQEMDAWLDSKGYAGSKRRVAKIFIRALRDYGFVVSDTGGTTAVGSVGSQNPADVAFWEAAGAYDRATNTYLPTNLLHGLITSADQLWVVEPPLDANGDWFTLGVSRVDTYTFARCSQPPPPPPTTAAATTQSVPAPAAAGMRAGAVAGIVVGVLLAALLAAALYLRIAPKRKNAAMQLVRI